MKWTFQSELCWIKILDFESHNGKRLRNLLASDLRKGIFSLFFSSYFYISKLASDPILADFHQPGNSLPPTQPGFFGRRRGPRGRTRSVDEFLCYPTKWNSCLFLKDAHTELLCHPACSTMGRVSLKSSHYLTLRRSEQLQDRDSDTSSLQNHCSLL